MAHTSRPGDRAPVCPAFIVKDFTPNSLALNNVLHSIMSYHANTMRNEQVVYFCDFIDYYRDLSAAIDNDEYLQGVALNA